MSDGGALAFGLWCLGVAFTPIVLGGLLLAVEKMRKKMLR